MSPTRIVVRIHRESGDEKHNGLRSATNTRSTAATKSVTASAREEKGHRACGHRATAATESRSSHQEKTIEKREERNGQAHRTAAAIKLRSDHQGEAIKKRGHCTRSLSSSHREARPLRSSCKAIEKRPSKRKVIE